ncbi:MAG: DUF401 family protein [Candidatus Thermoplasmatota archaeon]|jgi:hypothetical protein|nr:DUF401 family protein [Candidatus Thermoplasmatota archaeon]MDP7265138.1 DUF401 family protein [Candidatus Thermoplasmatota archaeon]
MAALVGIGFFCALFLILVIARKSLWLAMFVGALYLGIFSPGLPGIPKVIWDTFTDPSILLLSLAIGIIPIIGGIMERSGLMDDLVNNLRMNQKSFLSVSPALIGLLPMPGGALLSAPLVERGGKGVPDDLKSAINVWYRHLFILIYPLGTLLAISKVAGFNLYVAVLYTLPGFFILFILGHLTLIRKVHGTVEYKERFSWKGLLIPLFIVLAAPAIHICFMNIFRYLGLYAEIRSELALVIGVSFSLLLSLHYGRIGKKAILPVVKKMKPWNFALIILGMFFFLGMFQASDGPENIKQLEVSATVLLVVIGFFLGAAMGRVTAPVFILYPIYITKYSSMSIIAFSIMYLAVFLGYVISPVHPCLIVTMEYFKVSYKSMVKRLAIPLVVALGIVFAAGFIML